MPRGGKREAGGRPPDEEEPRTRMHCVRATDSAIDRWRLAADIEGKSVSEWTREALDARAERTLSEGDKS